MNDQQKQSLIEVVEKIKSTTDHIMKSDLPYGDGATLSYEISKVAFSYVNDKFGDDEELMKVVIDTFTR